MRTQTVHLTAMVPSYIAFLREVLLLLGALGAVKAASGASTALLAGSAAAALQLWCIHGAAVRVERIRGHRAGAHGYDGA